MASRNAGCERNPLTDRDSCNGVNVRDGGCKCPQTWKAAVVILVMSALFLVGVVVGYVIATNLPKMGVSNGSNTAAEAGGTDEAEDGNRRDPDELPHSTGMVGVEHLMRIHQKFKESLTNLDEYSLLKELQ